MMTLVQARRQLDMTIGVASIADHPRMMAHRALCLEKAKALATADAQVSGYAAELQQIATALRESKVAAAMGEPSTHGEGGLRARQKAVEEHYAVAQDERATLAEVVRRLQAREDVIVGEVTAELVAEVRQRDNDLVPMVMALAETLVGLNAKRMELHRLGLDANLLPVIPELLADRSIAQWLGVAQAAGFQPARK